MKSRELTQEILKEIFNYNPDTGVFHWKKSRYKNRVNKIAGCICKHQKYIVINIGNDKHYAHRLAYLFFHGEIDNSLVIDHINRIRNDNRICNLRQVTIKENLNNKNPKKIKIKISKIKKYLNYLNS